MKFITSNEGKFREVNRILQSYGISVERIDARYPEIQAKSLEDVAAFALDWLSSRYQGDLLIDDSGLFVKSLKEFPGVYSSFVFHTIGCQGMLKLMEGLNSREARFECCLGLLRGGERKIFVGRCYGSIASSIRGERGFGFDPIFLPQGHSKTFAEMTLEEKNSISHRGKAMEQLANHLRGGA